MQVSLSNFGHYFRTDQWLFRGLTKKFEAGEVYGLVGPSGSGKSTLLSLIAGWVPAVEGHVSIQGECLSWVAIEKYGRTKGHAIRHEKMQEVAPGLNINTSRNIQIVPQTLVVRSYGGSTALVTMLPLTDRYGRTAKDLRISLTDRCNLRCTYCMPEEGLTWLNKDTVMSADEVTRLARIAIHTLGIERIRLTGGEPLLRHDLIHIVSRLRQISTDAGRNIDIALTTNGLSLEKHAEKLAKAGLSRVNVSLDALSQESYFSLTRRQRIDDVLRGLEAAHQAGLTPIKINAVALPSNLAEIPALLRMCLNKGWQLRVIEHMPLGPRETWNTSILVTAEHVRQHLREKGFHLHELPREDGRPAQLWHVAGNTDHPEGTIGIIASMSTPFCGDCDRTRLTADGVMISCLFGGANVDLLTPMRSGATDQDIIELWRHTMWNKPRAHGSDDGIVGRPERTMSAIGG